MCCLLLMKLFNCSFSAYKRIGLLVTNLMNVSDTTTHEIKWEGAFNAISSDIKVKRLQLSTQTHSYAVI